VPPVAWVVPLLPLLLLRVVVPVPLLRVLLPLLEPLLRGA